MCKYCEQNERKLFKPMAVNDVGFKIPLVGIAFREDTDDKVLQVNFDESEPLQIAINYCPICGARLSPPAPMLFEDMSENPTGVGCYRVPIGKDAMGNDKIVAVPNPQDNYALFCSQIKKIATGEFYDLSMPWCIQRLWVLLKKQIPKMKFDYDMQTGRLTIKIKGCHHYIATENFLYLPSVGADGVVYFNTPTSWQHVTDDNYEFMKFVFTKIAEGDLKLPTPHNVTTNPST